MARLEHGHDFISALISKTAQEGEVKWHLIPSKHLPQRLAGGHTEAV